MSSSTPRTIDYLQRQLARNPVHESVDIVRARASEFDLETKQASSSEAAPSQENRQQVRKRLEQIRQHCFSAPVDQLLERLGQLPVGDFPELAALAGRLTVILKNRDKLAALTSHRRFDADFFSVLRKVLLTPAREVALLREQVMVSFRRPENRSRGQAMIRLLKANVPEVYALEADWLDSLLRLSLRGQVASTSLRPRTVQTASERGSGGSLWPLWSVLILLALGARIGMLHQEQSRDRRPSAPMQVPKVSSNPAKPESDALADWFEQVQEQMQQRRNRPPVVDSRPESSEDRMHSSIQDWGVDESALRRLDKLMEPMETTDPWSEDSDFYSPLDPSHSFEFNEP